MALQRHTRADGEEITRFDSKYRPARDDLLDGKDAVAKSELLLDASIDRQTHFQSFELVPANVY